MAPDAHDHISTSDAAAAQIRSAAARDSVGTTDSAGTQHGSARTARDSLGTSDAAGRGVLLKLGPAIVRASASLEVTIIPGIRPDPRADSHHELAGQTSGSSSSAGDLTVDLGEASGSSQISGTGLAPSRGHDEQAQQRTSSRVGSIDIGVTRAGWLIGVASGMGTISQCVAPGNVPVGIGSVAFGYAWAYWRWNQRDE